MVLVNAMGSVRFITKFEDFADNSVPYMYHCHMLVHEDNGMMGQFIVLDESTAGEGELDVTPSEFTLYPAYPNPFNPVTSLRYDLTEDAQVNITIYDMMGRIVKTLVNGSQTAG